MKLLACIFAVALSLLLNTARSAPAAPALTKPAGRTFNDSTGELTMTTRKPGNLQGGCAGVLVAAGVFESFRWST
jgi:hypothetical protein